jgi:hypothetical protein
VNRKGASLVQFRTLPATSKKRQKIAAHPLKLSASGFVPGYAGAIFPINKRVLLPGSIHGEAFRAS